MLAVPLALALHEVSTGIKRQRHVRLRKGDSLDYAVFLQQAVGFFLDKINKFGKVLSLSGICY
jgi:hypothetical protein